jgi:hypothetical protein
MKVRKIMNEEYTIEKFLEDLMNIQDDNSDEAMELSYKACDLLIDSHGMLIHENLMYIISHNVMWHIGDSDGFGVLTIVLEWEDSSGNSHEMLIG